jgi:hypothetical protein
MTDVNGRYDLSIELKDKRKQQETLTGRLIVRAMKCANIFDLSSSSSFVQLDIDSVKG